MKISKADLGFLGKLILSLIKALPLEQAFTAMLIYLQEKAAKTDSPWDDRAVKIAWLLRDYIFGKTKAEKRPVLIKQIQEGTLMIE
jgi:hypothetical protein